MDGDVPTPVLAVANAAPRVTVERAITLFLAEHTAAANTQKKYRLLLLKKLKEHSESKGYVLIEQWSPLDVREFRAGWKVSPITASKNLTIVKSFFEFGEQRMDCPQSRAAGQRGARASDSQGAAPLQRRRTGSDVRGVRNAVRQDADPLVAKTHHHAVQGETVNYKYKWSGQDLADFISVSVYTGLRISDVCTFHADRLRKSGECEIRTTKNGRKVYTWIPEWLQERIRQRAIEHGALIFGEHRTQDINVVTDVWRRKLKRLWKLCGPWPEKATPHRFRHTFARILLQRADRDGAGCG